MSENARHVMKDARAREERLSAAMLSCRTMQEACKVAGVSVPTAWRMRKTEAFQQRFKEVKHQAFESAVNGLHDSALVFVQTLRDICLDPKARGSEKATAARSGLDALVRSIEVLDLGERIAKLEQVAGEGK